MTIKKNMKKHRLLLSGCRSLILFALYVGVAVGLAPAQGLAPIHFDSPEDAVETLIKALKSDDLETLMAIFGSGNEELLSSGDPVADEAGRRKFIDMYEQKNKLERESADRAVLYLGSQDWPFSIPMVKKNGRWTFDSAAGREELLARRIGRNELSVIQVCLAYIDAQREYALKDWNGDGLHEYAQKFASAPGKKDGLYWKIKQGEVQSPFGLLVARAQEQGYTGSKISERPVPYHGYYYRILKAQGQNAPGGAYDYIVSEKMIGGFALVAYPAKYGSSGIMTFIANHGGEVYQKDLGRNTEKIALAMTLFDPDSTWKKVSETLE